MIVIRVSKTDLGTYEVQHGTEDLWINIQTSVDRAEIKGREDLKGWGPWEQVWTVEVEGVLGAGEPEVHWYFARGEG